MFDGNVFIKDTCKNVVENGKVIGYEMQTHITYYRGIPLSMINYLKVAVDGVEVPEEDIRFTPDGIDWFTLKEMETVSAIKWEYGTPGTVRVLKEPSSGEAHSMHQNSIHSRSARGEYDQRRGDRLTGRTH